MKHFYPVTSTFAIWQRCKRWILFIVACFLMQNAAAQTTVGNAHLFNGTNQYDSLFRYIDGNNINYDYSVEAWVKPGATTGIMSIFSTRANNGTGDHSFDLKLQNGNLLHADIGDGTNWITTTADATFNYQAGRWYHIAFTVSSFSSRKYSIYINGELAASAGINTGIGALLFDANHKSGYVGANPRIGNEYFNGSIDEVKLYGGTLSQAQVQQDMLGTLTDFSGVTKQVYYNYNQSSGTVVNDGAGNGLGPFNATAINAASWAESFAMVVPVAKPATVTGKTSFTANWAAPATGSFDNYILDVSTAADFSSSLATYPRTIDKTITSSSFSGLSSTSKYYYRVRADKNSLSGQGAWSPTKAVATPPGNALSFDGNGEYVQVTTDGGEHIYQGFAVEAWVKIASATGAKAIIGTTNTSFSNAFEMGIFGDSSLHVNIGNIGTWLAQGQVAYKFNLNTWYHVACVVRPSFFVGGNLTPGYYNVFINGDTAGTGVVAGFPTFLGTPYNDMYIGCNKGIEQFFNGAIDEVKIYGGGIDQPMVRADMVNTGGAGVSAATGVRMPFYYQFDQSSGSTLDDASGNNYTGTLVNGPAWVESYAMVIPTVNDAAAISGTSFQASWIAPSTGSFSGYYLDVATSPNFSAVSMVPGYDAKPVSGLSQAVTNLPINQTYYYRVRADKTPALQQGAYSATKSLTLLSTAVITSFTPAAAARGNTITIKGNHFTGAAGVTFGGVPAASFTIVNDSTITAVLGLGSSGDIVVSNVGGAGIATGFTSIPVISSFTPVSAAITTTITITGNSFTGATAVTFGGTAAASFTVVNDNTITAVVGTGSTGSVSVTNAGFTGSGSGFTMLPPVITSFTPVTGKPGSTLTITGSNFYPGAAGNTVYIGGVKAQVTAGSSSSLTVTVPNGATNEPVSVTAGALTGYSSKSFIPVFAGASVGLSSNSFAAAVTKVASSFNQQIVMGDLDGDGKTDIGLGYGSTAGKLSLYRNTGTPGNIVFDDQFDITTAGSQKILFADMDGDGKLDIVGCNQASISIFRNISAAGSFAFATKVDIGLNVDFSRTMDIGDIDGDGKPDVVILDAQASDGTVRVFKNTTVNGNFSLVATTVMSNVNANDVSASDMDNDGKPDLVVVQANGLVAILKNTGSINNIAFNSPVTFTSNSYTNSNLCIADLDGDNYNDIIVRVNGSTVAIRNATSAGTLAFESPLVVSGSFENSIGAGDVNGDGKVDILTSGGSFSGGRVFVNTSAPGTLSFDGGSRFSGANDIPVSPITADVDGDGRPDVISSEQNNRVIKIFRNQINEPVITSFTASAIEGATITINGIYLTSATRVNIGADTAASFQVVSDNVITAVVGKGSTGNISITTSGGTATKGTFTWNQRPDITSFSPQSAAPGATVTLRGIGFTNTAFVKFGETAAASYTVLSDTVLTAVVDKGSSGSVIVKNAFSTDTLAGFSVIVPVINSFSPSSGLAGSVVLIKGKGFNSTPANNTVYMGGGRAIVTAGTDSTLTVTVPATATYGKLMVAANGLTGYSSKAFTITFTGGDTAINSNSFSGQSVFYVQPPNFGRKPIQSMLYDFDRDGKLDEVLIYYPSNGIVSIVGNQSTPGNFSLGPIIDNLGRHAAAADFDGDGFLDVAIAGDQSVTVFKNTSAPGLSFSGAASVTSASFGIYQLTAGDIDGDGRPDLVIMHNGVVEVRRNTSTGAGISFGPAVNFTTATFTSSGVLLGNFCLRDMDGDGRPELLSFSKTNTGINIMRNTSTQGTVSFDAPIALPVPGSLTDFAAEDIDNDGKPDIEAISNNQVSVYVYQNTSSTGNLSFGSRLDFPLQETGGALANIAAGDLNGDGKIDLAISDYGYFNGSGSGGISILYNTGSAGNPAFGSKLIIPTGTRSEGMAIGDMDGDGAPDLAFGNDDIANASYTSVMFNKTRYPNLVSFSPTSSYTDSTVTLKGTNLSAVTTVKFGGVAARSFTVVSDTTITAIVDTGSTGYVYVSSSFGADSVAGFTYNKPPTVTSFTPSTAYYGQTVTINGTNFINVKSVSFGGRPARSFTTVNATKITAVVDSGTSGSIVVITPAGTATLAGFTYLPVPLITSFSPVQGGKNTAVTIKGSGFTGVTAVTFGGTAPVSFAVVSDTIITAVTGISTTGKIIVINPGGADTSDGTFSFVSPIINSFTPTSVQLGDTIILKGTYFNGVTAVKFGTSSIAAPFTFLSDTTIKTVADNASGNTISVTTPLGTGSIAGLNIVRPPLPGNALNFDGSNDYVTVPRSITGDFTIEYWMKTSQPSLTGTQWHEGGGIVDGEVGGLVTDFGTSLLNDKLAFGMGFPSGSRDVTIFSKSVVNTGRWVHVAAVRIKATGLLKLYINGVLEATGNAGTGDIVSSNITIGAIATLAHYFNGSVDELRIFTTDRSNNIAADMFSTVSPATTGLAAYYNFDFGTAGGANAGLTTLYDQSLNGNKGTLRNLGLTDTVSNWVESYAMVVPVASAATNRAVDGFTANWGAPAYGSFDNYSLDVSTDSTFTSLVPGYDSKLVTGTSEILTGLNAGTIYWYRVRADKASPSAVHGQGAYSNKIAYKTYGVPVITSFTPIYGAPGITVTISGHNFTDVSAVSFGGTPAASFTVTDTATITAVVANGATGDVSVTTPGGVATDTGFVFLLPPTITSFTPTSTNIGSIITITGTNFIGTSQVLFGNTSAVAFTVVSDNVIKATLGIGSAGDVAVVSPAGTATKSALSIVPLTPPGNALGFNNGSNVTISTGNVSVAGSYTVEAWINPSDGTRLMNILSTRAAGGDQTFDVSIKDGNILHADIGTGSGWLTIAADATLNYQPGTWYHVAYVVSPNGYTVYINGQAAGSGTFSGTPLLFNSVHNILTLGRNPGEEFNGYMDEVKIWSSQRTAAEVQQDMMNAIAVPGLETNLVAYYNFDEGTAGDDNTGTTTLVNLYNNTLTGVLNGFALTGNTSNWVESYAMVVPTAVAASAVTATGFTVNWAPPVLSNAGSYRLQVSTDSNFTTLITSITGVTGTTQDVTGLAPDTKYWYRVGAVKAITAGNGAWSNAVVTTLPVPVITFFNPPNATHSTEITITGNHFTNVTGVSFGGTPAASFNVVDSTTITAIVGGGASGDIVVTNNRGAGTAHGFTFVSLSATLNGPSVACSDASPQVTFTAFNGVAPYTFSYRQNGVDKTVTTVTGNSIMLPIPVDQDANYSYVVTGVTDAEGFSQSLFVIFNTRIGHPSSSVLPVTICSSQAPYNWNGTAYSVSGSYTYVSTNASGCQDIATLQLTVLQSTTGSESATVCSSQLPYHWNDNDYYETGTYTFNTTNVAGCDSTVTLYLTVKQVSYSTTETTICHSALPYNWNGVDYTGSGTYTATLTNAVGCDSIATLILHADVLESTTEVTVDSRDLPYNWNGVDYTTEGTYTFNTTNYMGCDSAAHLVLTIIQNTLLAEVHQAVCAAQLPYNWNGVDYYAPGSYQYQTTAISNPNVDSIVTLILTVNDATSHTENVTICQAALPYVWNGTSYTQSGTYTFTTTNAVGCDSVVTLILKAKTDTTLVSAAVDQSSLPYHWNGNDYSTGGLYTIHATNVAGCDSVVQLRLIIKDALPPAAFSYTSPNVFTITKTISSLTPAKVAVGTASIFSNNFTNPLGLQVDAAGNVYVVDAALPFVVKIAPDGVTKTNIGDGLNNPQAIGLDAAGNIYVADFGNRAIKKISSDGTQTTLVSGGYSFYGMAVDAAGNVFATDASNAIIWKIDHATGAISPFRADNDIPQAITVDPDGNVYVFDANTNNVIKIAPDGNSSSIFMSSVYATGLAADIYGNIYISNANVLQVNKITPGGVVSTVAANIYLLYGLGFDADGNVYGANPIAGNISKIAGASAAATYAISPALPAGLVFNSTTGVISGIPSVISPATTYTVTAANVGGNTTAKLVIQVNEVPVTSAPSAFTYTTPNTFAKGAAISPLAPSVVAAGTATTFVSDNFGPYGVATDSVGNVYVADIGGPAIKKLSPAGAVLGTFGSGFVNAFDVTVDGQGNIYVADPGLNVVKKISPDGVTITSIGTGWQGPHDVAADKAGNVYVVEFGPYLKKIAPDGTVNKTFYRDNFGTDAVTVDAAGNVYVITDNNVIKKLSSSGTVLATIGTIPGGQGSLSIGGIALDADGNVYVSAFIYAQGTGVVYKVDGFDGTATACYTSNGFLYGMGFNGAGTIYVCEDDKITRLAAGGGAVSGYAINPPLPAGLSINAATGIISGTAKIASPQTSYTVTATNIKGSTNAVLSIAVLNNTKDAFDYATPNVFRVNKDINPLAPVYKRAPAIGGVLSTVGSGFAQPNGVVQDAAGNLYISNAGWGRIDKISPGGTVTPLKPNFTFGYSGRLAMDAQGYIYVPQPTSASGNILKIDAAGNTVASLGNGSFNGAGGLAIDALGYIYVADYNHSAVKRMNRFGDSITTIGTGMYYPQNVAVDAQRNVYVTEPASGKVKVISADGITTTVIASGLNGPAGIAVDANGNVYVTEQFGNVLKKIPAGGGTVVTVLTGLNNPQDVYLGNDDNLYISDTYNNLVKKLTTDVNQYTNFTITPALPTGLLFDANTGIISGKPTVTSSQTTYTVNVLKGTDTAVAQLQIAVTEDGTKAVAVCTNRLPYHWQGNDYYTSGTYTVHYTNVKGRDSAVTLDLVVNANPVVTVQITPVCGVSVPLVTISATGTGPFIGTGDFTQTAAERNKEYIVKDGNGCIAGVVVNRVIPTPVLTATFKKINAGSNRICYNENASLVALTEGGVKPYQYSLNGGPFQASNSFVVQGGIHAVTIKDAAGCSITVNDTITQAPAPLILDAQVVPVSCNNNTILLNASGGFGNYLYNNNGGGFTTNTAFTNIPAGNDTIRVFDEYGCSAKKYISIKALTATAVTDRTQVCYGAKTTVNVVAKNGYAPYQYSIDGVNFQLSKTFKVPGGNFAFTVKDDAGCTVVTNTLNITEAAQPLALTVSRVNVSCPGNNDGTITATATGGFGGYTYANNSGAYQPGNVFSNLYAGANAVQVKDAAGCTANANVTITQPAVPCSSLGSEGNNPTSGTAEMHSELKVKVLPNPAKVEFKLSIVSGDSKYIIELRVMDMNGKIVYHTRGSVFDMYSFGREFAGGMYVAEVLNGKNIQRIKLVKAN